MDFKDINVPYLGSEDIKNKANLFREKNWDNSVPVDVENIIEFELNIEIRPIPNLRPLYGFDSMIDSRFKVIFVDNRALQEDSSLNRLRFSLAHEVGHFVLHNEIYKAFNLKKAEDLVKLIEEIPSEQYDYLETQANIFANCLLLPRDKLQFERNQIMKKVSKKYDLDEFNKDNLNKSCAKILSKKFIVSEAPIEIALKDIDNNN